FPDLNRTKFAQDWQQWDILHHREIQVHTGAEVLSGTSLGVDAQGQLDVLLNNGVRRSFSSADVSVRW
ncbi:MAG: Unknown protein, partial [uncultured Thiotrichaceae bacterium]